LARFSQIEVQIECFLAPGRTLFLFACLGLPAQQVIKETLQEMLCFGVRRNSKSQNRQDRLESDAIIANVFEFTQGIGGQFDRFAGADRVMDEQEFNRFTKAINLPRQHASLLWRILDRDGSGEVARDEFTATLEEFQRARQWSRYCPNCDYLNDCSYCRECNANCEKCNERTFCARCWEEHPGRHSAKHAAAATAAKLAGQPVYAVNTTEAIRKKLVIAPLTWVYEELTWLTTDQKAVIRRTLQAQLKLAAAAEAAAGEEQIAVAAREAASEDL